MGQQVALGVQDTATFGRRVGEAVECQGYDTWEVLDERGKRKRRKKMPAQTKNELRTLAISPETLAIILQGLLEYGIYCGFAAKYDGSISIFAKADKKTATWNLVPMEDPIQVMSGLMELLGVNINEHLT